MSSIIEFKLRIKSSICSQFVAWIISISLLSCGGGHAEAGRTAPIIIPETSAFISNTDHNSEAHIVRCNSGKLIVFWRLDPGIEGDHIGNNAYIAMRSNTGSGWSVTSRLFDSAYDDRNMSAWVMPNSGRVCIMFRRYDATKNAQIDLCLMHSDDEGETWSIPASYTTAVEVEVPSPSMPFYVENVGMCVPMYGFNASRIIWLEELWITTDGETFIKKTTVDSTITSSNKYGESAYCYLGDGVALAAFRNEHAFQSPAWPGVSLSLCTTFNTNPSFTTPVRIPTIPAYWISAPLLFFDGSSVYLLCGDRRATEPNVDNAGSKLWIYRSTRSRLVDDLSDWTLLYEMARPVPSEYVFYGYPSLYQNFNGTASVVFTERTHSGSNEDAWLYQFDLHEIRFPF